MWFRWIRIGNTVSHKCRASADTDLLRAGSARRPAGTRPARASSARAPILTCCTLELHSGLLALGLRAHHLLEPLY